MNRVEAVQQRVNAIVASAADAAWKRKFYVHLYGVSQACVALALRRGLDPVLGAVLGLLHDIAAVGTGNYDDHCNRSADMAIEIFRETDLFTPGECALMDAAIRNHDFRDRVDAPYDELLKDADILHPYLTSLRLPQNEPTMRRLQAMLEEAFAC